MAPRWIEDEAPEAAGAASPRPGSKPRGGQASRNSRLRAGTHDRAQIKKVIARMTVGAYVILAVGAIVLEGLVYGATRLLG